MSTYETPAETNTPVEYDEVEQTLEANGVDVVSLKETAADPYLRYRHDEDDRKKLQVVIALVFAKEAHLVRETVQVAAVDGEGVRVGYFYIELSILTAFNEGVISKKEYAKKVVDTWNAFGSGAE